MGVGETEVDNGGQEVPPATLDDARAAAIRIQKAYRGHRTRRQLDGFGLDASTRWYEALKDSRYHALTTPAPSQPLAAGAPHDASMSPARRKWQWATEIARRAGADDRSPSPSDAAADDADHPDGHRSPRPQSPSATADGQQAQDGRGEQDGQNAQTIQLHKQTAKMMDLQYFLEMVDQKHRYGSNLRKYHNYWKEQDTRDNFFYWLDHGDGRDVELPECSRARLDNEQVRYLSRDERLHYLVQVDADGLLVWAKNGERVWTKDELYRDSLKGIVPVSDPTPPFRHNVPPDEVRVPSPHTSDESDGDASDSDDDDDDDDDEEKDENDNEDEEEQEGKDATARDNTAGDEGERYVNEDFHRARGLAKVKHVSAAVLFNHMIRTSLKKGHKWIFVADTALRLYIGYKQSGAFQHSSFLHGARILAAGLIKVKDGQLRRLSPLSGHYRPPAANFRLFVHALRDRGVDMSRVSISRSYAVLVGLEGYVHTRRRVKSVEATVVREKDKLLHPDKVRREEEAARDKSQSAEIERRHLERQRAHEEREARAHKADANLGDKVSRALDRLRVRSPPETQPGPRRLPGTGPEDGIPAPEGQR